MGNPNFIGSDSSSLLADTVFADWDQYEFRAKAVSRLGSDVYSDIARLTVPESPPAVFIDKKGPNMLVAAFNDPSAEFQWKKNGVDIDGATKQFYFSSDSINTERDTYSVVITLDQFCFTESEVGFVVEPPFEEEPPISDEENNAITVGPNPNKGVFTAIWSSNYEGPATLKIVSVYGDQLLNHSFEKEGLVYQYAVDLPGTNTNFSPGIHFVVINYGGKVSSQKIFIRP